MAWRPFDDGANVGTSGSEGGTILCDDEHVDGARITLESDELHARWSITCGIYGWFVHTRFFSSRGDADDAFATMKMAIAELLLGVDDEQIKAFVERFP